jgi:hypothetical protein
VTLTPPNTLPDPAALSPEGREEWRRFYPAYLAACQAVWQMGYDAGWTAAEADMAALWADVARRVRAMANQPTWHELRRERGDEDVSTPRPGDFTGYGMAAVERLRAADQRAKTSSERKAA